ncbi:MAG: DUSAM domain-containing protein [Hyalangium sp.]|uniref:DUSAM domain-containing protein n=1 Tax=Hyalangium sp. TaxID=2028555 RepID=UPI00389AB8B8
MGGKIDWDPIRVLAQRVLDQSEPLELTDEARTLLRRSAREVAIPAQDAAKALRSPSSAKVLLRQIRRRIQDGARRLAVAEDCASRREDAGDLNGAREQFEQLLAVEVVPLYRKQARNMLASIARLQKVAKTGRVDPKLPALSQLTILLHRLDQSEPLKLTEGMRSFLRRAAAEAGISKAEAQAALSNPRSAGALLREIVGRRQRGSRRLGRALLRMMDLRDAGDLEGARQQMRDLLAVEVVPVYRQAAEENLAGLDEPPPAP